CLQLLLRKRAMRAEDLTASLQREHDDLDRADRDLRASGPRLGCFPRPAGCQVSVSAAARARVLPAARAASQRLSLQRPGDSLADRLDPAVPGRDDERLVVLLTEQLCEILHFRISHVLIGRYRPDLPALHHDFDLVERSAADELEDLELLRGANAE